MRCALLKQHLRLSYEDPTFHLEEFGLVSRLRAAAAVVDAEEVGAAQDHQRHPGSDMGGDQSRPAGQRQEKVETGKVELRLDSTVAAALMHEPSDGESLCGMRPA